MSLKRKYIYIYIYIVLKKKVADFTKKKEVVDSVGTNKKERKE